MKKWISVICVMAMVASLMVVSGFGVSAAGDSFGDATKISINKLYKNQEITKESSKDYFSFTLPSSGRMTISITAKLKESVYKVYTATGFGLYKSATCKWDASGVLKKEIVLDLQKGEYRFSVNSKTPGTYSFKVAFVAAKETFVDTEDDQKIEFGKTYKAQLAETERDDYFYFNMKEAGTVSLKVTSDVKLIGVSNSHPVSSGGSIVRGGEIKKGTSEIVFEMEKGSQTISFHKKKGTGNYSFKLICHHNWKTKSVDKASLTAAGKLHQKCGVCGETKTVAIKKVRSHKLTATTYTYDGKAKTPSVVVRDTSGKVLKKGTDYSVTYSSGRINPGEYKATVKMKGNYTGTKVLTFKILPGKTSKITATPGKTQLALKWSAVKGATGYKIEIKSVTSGSTIKTITTINNLTTVKGLKNKTKYKVIVTAYKTFNGKKMYAKVSKSITTSTAAPKA